ncbi:cell division protein FtsK [Streptomyces sp. MS1.AVA.3]|uniref:cell division protein FtsK n=1 Tax=Streptomyces decoyicus TaxID=249567 RepID=UPI0030BD10D7
MPLPPAQTAIPIQVLRNSVCLDDSYTLAALESVTTPLLGLAHEDQPVCLPAEPVHVMVSTSAGGGSTTLLRGLMAQLLRLGAHIDVIDTTSKEHAWAAGLDGVEYFTHIEDIHEYLVDAAQDVLRDNAGTQAVSGWERRRIVVIENADQVVFGLRQYWRHTRPESQLDETPAVEAIAVLQDEGRRAGLSLFVSTPSAQIPGTGPVPDAFGVRVLAHGCTNQWMRAAPEIWPVPPLSLTRGRMYVVSDRQAVRMQCLYMSPGQARAWASDVTRKEFVR